MSQAPPSTNSPYHQLYVGIYADERVLQLLDIMKELGENCFQHLHRVAAATVYDQATYVDRFRRGLQSIGMWDMEVRQNEANVAIRQYPQLGYLYRYGVVRYLKELYRNEQPQQVNVTLPPLADFLHTYYLCLSRHESMYNLQYLNAWGLEKTHIHMEALRRTLMQCTREDYHNQNASVPGIVSEIPDVTPWDSVSQRGDEDQEEPRIPAYSRRELSSFKRESSFDKEFNKYYHQDSQPQNQHQRHEEENEEDNNKEEEEQNEDSHGGSDDHNSRTVDLNDLSQYGTNKYYQQYQNTPESSEEPSSSPLPSPQPQLPAKDDLRKDSPRFF